MDKIKFIFEEPHKLEGSEIKEYSMKIQLNEDVLPHEIVNLSSVLPLYQFHFAEFDLFTCGCGEPGCAGFQHSVFQTMDSDVVMWKFPETNDYSTDKKIYFFDKKLFVEEFQNAFIKVKCLEEENIYHETFIRDESMYAGYDEEEDLFSINGSICESFNWYCNRYKGWQNFYDLLSKEFPVLFEKSFYWVYDDEKIEQRIGLMSLIGNILNQYPSKEHEHFFLAKVKLAVKAIQHLLEGNNELFKRLVKHGYGHYGLGVYDVVSWYVCDVVEEKKFEVDKLSLMVI